MEGQARNIGELTLACIELAARLGELTTAEEKESCITEHLVQYSRETLPMVDFDTGLEWFNVSRPLTLGGDLHGRISVLDFFTYCCINCMHILPDLEELESLHPPSDGEVLVVGVHSAKFENEKLSENILAAIQRYGIQHPVVNDPKASMWMALGISCWPTLLILGPSNEPLFVLVGEGHRERLKLYVDVAIKHFSNSGSLKNASSVPLAPSEHCQATSSILRFPGKVAVHPGGLIVSDSGHHRLLIIDHLGNVKHVVGCGETGHQDGSFSSSKFANPQGTVYLHPNIIFVADTGNHLIRKVDLVAETVSTIAGTGKKGTDHEGGNMSTSQVISSPWDICLTRTLDQTIEESENLLLVAMAGTHQIWGVFLSDGKWIKGSFYEKGTVVRLAGSGAEENRNTSYPARAGFAQPSGLTCCTLPDRTELFIADSESSTIRKFDLKDGSVKAVVGGARDPLDLFAYGDVDGSGVEAKLQHPMGVTSIGRTVYVADSYNSKIKVVQPSGKTFAVSTISISDSRDSVDGNKNRELNEPAGLCAAHDGSCLFIADTNNHAIKILSLSDHSLQEFPVRMVDEGDSSCQDLLNGNAEAEDELQKVMVSVPLHGARDVILQIKLNFPEGVTLNEEAPNKWKVESHDPCLVLRASHGTLQHGSELLVSLPAADSNSHFDLILSCAVFPCLPSGVCVAAVAKCAIHLTCTEGETATKKEIPINVRLKL